MMRQGAHRKARMDKRNQPVVRKVEPKVEDITPLAAAAEEETKTEE